MTAIRMPLVLVALSLLPALPAREASAACSAAALEAAHASLRDAVPPDCGTRSLRRVFKRAHRRAASATARAALQCETAGTARIAVAHNALLKAIAQIGRLNAAGRVDTTCAVAYETELLTLDAALTAAANGVAPTTTTTSTTPPGVPTTTTLPSCTAITLDVDRVDCTSVTSDPAGLVECSGTCDAKTFTVPAVGSLQLKGTPAPGDTSVSFSGDCNADGTVPLGDASPPDCFLSCDCSSAF